MLNYGSYGLNYRSVVRLDIAIYLHLLLYNRSSYFSYNRSFIGRYNCRLDHDCRHISLITLNSLKLLHSLLLSLVIGKKCSRFLASGIGKLNSLYLELRLFGGCRLRIAVFMSRNLKSRSNFLDVRDLIRI